MNEKNPKLEICTSFSLHLSILGTKFDPKKMDSFRKAFKIYIKKYEKKVLRLISKYSGLEWKKKIIKIWLFDGWYPSISYPLLLNVYEYNKRFAFFILIHELTHNIFLEKNIVTKKGKTINMNNMEAIIELITKKVAENIFSEKIVKKLCKESEFDGTYKFIWEKEKELEKEWDLNKKPLIEWIKTKSYKIKNENEYF